MFIRSRKEKNPQERDKKWRDSVRIQHPFMDLEVSAADEIEGLGRNNLSSSRVLE